MDDAQANSGHKRDVEDMSLPELREIYARNRRSVSELAARLDPPVSHATVSLVLNGKSTSARIVKAARKYAAELLAKEAREAAEEAEDLNGKSVRSVVSKLRGGGQQEGTA